MKALDAIRAGLFIPAHPLVLDRDGRLDEAGQWTREAVRIFERARAARRSGSVAASLLTLAAELTDAHGAVFDVDGGFAGCIAGIHEVLRRQGLVKEVRLLDPAVRVWDHQRREIDRVVTAYPHLTQV